MNSVFKFFVFIILAVVAVYFYGTNSMKKKQLEQEYKAALQAAATYKVQIPDVPPLEELDLPDDVVVRLHKSLHSRNVEEAGKAMDLLWKVQDPDVLPVMNKHLAAKRDTCWSDCSNITPMKIKVLEIVERDISQINFELLCKAITDRDKEVRMRALTALKKFRTDDAVEVMNKLMSDRDSEIRTAAIEGVMEIKNGIKDIRNAQIMMVEKEYKKKMFFKERISPEAIMETLN